tara:strand:+ start:3716 stop:4036 length:321 start_codon:yes stop_codon:yes gene_type:complete
MVNWVNIEDKTPEEGKRLLYFFEGTGVWTGFYYGRNEEYPDSNNHVFGCEAGFLTGDVTHWCYINYPEEGEWREEQDKEFFKESKKEMIEVQIEWNNNFKEMLEYE